MSDFWWNRFPQKWHGNGLVSLWISRCVDSVDDRYKYNMASVSVSTFFHVFKQAVESQANRDGASKVCKCLLCSFGWNEQIMSEKGTVRTTLNRLPHSEHSKHRDGFVADDVALDACCRRWWSLGNELHVCVAAAVVCASFRAAVLDAAGWTRLSGTASAAPPARWCRWYRPLIAPAAARLHAIWAYATHVDPAHLFLPSLYIPGR